MADSSPQGGPESAPCTAFEGARIVAAGTAAEVARALAAQTPARAPVVIDDATGRQIDLLPPGATAPPPPPRATRPRGRPKLGVVAREVTLLPRHWEWLAGQRGGASASLRRLVDQARKADSVAPARAARDAAYRAMTALGGDLPGFEEAVRALYASDEPAFAGRIADWPEDLRAYTGRIAAPAFASAKGVP